MLKNLRNYFTICVVSLFSIVMLSACSDNDDEKTTSQDIVGTWVTTHAKGWDKVNGKIDEEWNYALDKDETEYYEFFSNGKYTCSDQWEEWEGTWKFSNGKLTLRDEDGETGPFNCSISGNKMTWSQSGKETEDGETYEWYEEVQLTRLVK